MKMENAKDVKKVNLSCKKNKNAKIVANLEIVSVVMKMEVIQSVQMGVSVTEMNTVLNIEEFYFLL